MGSRVTATPPPPPGFEDVSDVGGPPPPPGFEDIDRPSLGTATGIGAQDLRTTPLVEGLAAASPLPGLATKAAKAVQDLPGVGRLAGISLDDLVQALPGIGGATGGILGAGGLVATGPGAFVAGAKGAALGGAAGESAKQLAQHALGYGSAPKTSLEAAKDIGLEAVSQTGQYALGEGAGRVAGKLIPLPKKPPAGLAADLNLPEPVHGVKGSLMTRTIAGRKVAERYERKGLEKAAGAADTAAKEAGISAGLPPTPTPEGIEKFSASAVKQSEKLEKAGNQSRLTRELADAETAVNEMLGKLSGAPTAEAGGIAGKAGIKRGADLSAAEGQRLYSEADELLADTIVDISGYKEALRQMRLQANLEPSLVAHMRKVLGKGRKSLGLPDQINYDQARQLQKQLTAQMEVDRLTNSASKGATKHMWGELTTALERAAAAQAPEGAEALVAANQFWRGHKGLFDRGVVPRVAKQYPEDLVKVVVPGSVSRARALRSAILDSARQFGDPAEVAAAEEAWNAVGSSFVRRTLMDGGVDALPKNMHRYRDVLPEMFEGTPAARDALQNLQTISRGIQDAKASLKSMNPALEAARQQLRDIQGTVAKSQASATKGSGVGGVALGGVLFYMLGAKPALAALGVTEVLGGLTSWAMYNQARARSLAAAFRQAATGTTGLLERLIDAYLEDGLVNRGLPKPQGPVSPDRARDLVDRGQISQLQPDELDELDLLRMPGA